ncbi:uncharacterized protein F54H12.2 [Trichonephila clavipes]|nr:uncharacterized protein F54H12.2 [Trichonephila clavipes]
MIGGVESPECVKSELNLFLAPPTQTVIEKVNGAIIETLLNHGYDSKTSQLTSELYYKDTAGRMNVYDENDKEPNEGFKSRVKFIKGSGTVDMVGRLHVDLFNQDRLY